MTLDGYGEFPKYPGSDVLTSEPDEVFKEMWIRRYDSVDTIIYGRRSYEDHVAYHSLSARKPSDPDFLFEFSRFLERSQKIVLSHHLKKADWKNSGTKRVTKKLCTGPSLRQAKFRAVSLRTRCGGRYSMILS